MLTTKDRAYWKLKPIERNWCIHNQGDLVGYRTNHRGAEITRMRDAIHQYNLEQLQKSTK
jgi:hypothetical protein